MKRDVYTTEHRERNKLEKRAHSGPSEAPETVDHQISTGILQEVPCRTHTAELNDFYQEINNKLALLALNNSKTWALMLPNAQQQGCLEPSNERTVPGQPRLKHGSAMTSSSYYPGHVAGRGVSSDR